MKGRWGDGDFKKAVKLIEGKSESTKKVKSQEAILF